MSHDRFFGSKELFVLDLANNHSGELSHGLEVIRHVGRAVQKHGVQAALKFQFRQLDTFIHPEFQNRTDLKYVKRFQETRLEKEEFGELVEEVRKQGMVPMATPFDEESLPLFREFDIPIIKIASCSINDWPLVESIASMRLPVIASTGGAPLSDIDRLVSFFEMKGVEFALMHCVSVYPTPDEKLRLNQIDLLKKRYPDVTVGWSTHEDQDNFSAVQLAYAKGARIFERHVGVPTEEKPLNGYSSTPEQLEKWFLAQKSAEAMCGGEERPPAYPQERAALDGLSRGAFAREGIRAGQPIAKESLFFAFPKQEGQLPCADWKQGLVADKDYESGEPLSEKLADQELSKEQLTDEILLQIKRMLSQARIFVGEDSAIEISHHYGLHRFREFGAVIITCIDREYCKKLIVQLPRQKHPYHYHQTKEETFQLLYGDAEVEVDGLKYHLRPGDKVLIKPGEWHKFHTLNGAIIEEVTTRDVSGDSIYEDPAISGIDREERKTQIDIKGWEPVLKMSADTKSS